MPRTRPCGRRLPPGVRALPVVRLVLTAVLALATLLRHRTRSIAALAPGHGGAKRDRSLLVLRQAAPLLGVILAVALAAGCNGSPQAEEAPADGVSVREVQFTATDDVELAGTVFGDGDVGLVLAHMFPADAKSWHPTARQLARQGYTALALDFRGHGDSKGEQESSMAVRDLHGAMRFLEGEDIEVAAIVGASMGGTAALVAAADMELSAVVAVSPPLRFHDLDAMESAGDIDDTPVLLMAAEEDGQAHESVSRLGGRLENAETRHFEGEGHGTNLLVDHPEAVETIVGFLLSHAPAGDLPGDGEDVTDP